MTLELKGEIERLRLSKDDVMIVSFQQNIAPQVRQAIKGELRELLGQDCKVMVLMGGAKLHVVSPGMTDEQRESLRQEWSEVHGSEANAKRFMNSPVPFAASGLPE